MERNWIIIQTGEGKMLVGGSKSSKRNVPYSDEFLSGPLSSGNESFFVCFCSFSG
jgi:hypothetical protein